MFLEITSDYVHAGRMTLFHVEQQPSDWFYSLQVAYMTDPVLKTAQKDKLVEWLLVLDMDEFMYAPNSTIAEVLAGLGANEVLVCAPWNFFGTSGLVNQPPCIVPFFVHRARAMFQGTGKCAVRTQDAIRLGVHYHYTRSHPFKDWIPSNTTFAGQQFRGIKGKRSPTVRFQVDEQDMHRWPLRLNHYQMQSEEHFRKKRLPDARRKHDEIHFYDVHTVLDDTLAKKEHWKRRNMPQCGPDGW